MLLLTSTSDALRLVTSAAASLTVHIDYGERNPATGAMTFGHPANALITTATTTTLLSGAASTERNARSIQITNNHATTPSQATVQHYDGTTSADLMGVTLLPGENLSYSEDGHWTHHDAQGAEYSYAGPPLVNLGAAGTLAETMPRETCPEVNSTIGATGTLFLQAIYLKAGQLVSNISVSSATTASATPTNGFFALYDASRNLLAQSANFTTEAWAANTIKTKAMGTAYRVTVSGLYYIGVLQVATTIATLKGGTAKTGGQLAGQAPILHGTSSTGLTTALPNPAAAITAGTATLYAAVS